MTAVAAWLRSDLRARWRSIVMLALLVAFASGTLLAAVAGARRGSTAVDRLHERTLPATAMVLPNQPGFDWEAVRALPMVEALAQFAVTDAFRVDELPEEAQASIGFPWVDDEIYRTIERPVVLEGRVPDAHRPDEVVVTRKFEDRYGRGVGDTLTLRLFTPAQVDAAMAGGEEEAQADGPVIRARIVGVVVGPWFAEPVGSETSSVSPGPGLYERYAPNLLGSERAVFVNALVRLRGGAAALPQFKEALARVSGRSDIDVANFEETADHLRDVTGFEANALLVFALAAGVTSVFLVGQSIARYAAASDADLHVLRAMGVTTRETSLAAGVGPTLAAIGGAVVGAAGAGAASRWFPLGTAASFEPSPGVEIDAPVFALGTVVTVAAVSVAAVASAAWNVRRRAVTTSTSRLASAVGRSGLPTQVVVGARFALERGFGRQAVPVRPAMVGAVVGVLGTVAALTFSNGVRDASDHPERFGQTYQLVAFFGFNGEDFFPTDDVLAAVADERDVGAVNDTRLDVVETNGRPFEIFSYDPVGTPLEVVTTEGRMPRATGEIALAPRTAEAIDASVGDTIHIKGGSGELRATVTALAFVPSGPHNDYATGAWVTEDGYEAVSDGFKFHFGLASVRDGVTPASVAVRLQERIGVALEEPTLPDEVAELRQVRSLPNFLAAFLAVLAVGAVGHALATAVRRRRHDLAALRALGMTAGQTRGIVITQATILATIGLLVGIPLGVATGRTLWRTVAENTPVAYLPPQAMAGVVLVVALALALANALAAVPSQRAATMRVGEVLRAE